MKHSNPLFVSTREAWRAWLAANHAGKTEVWLAYAKKHTGKPRVAYQDAVDEALCFGWIDSTIHRVDDTYYAQRFTPRRPRSGWSETNRRRFRALVKEGRMTAAGLAKHPRARGNFERMAPSHRRLYVRWIDSAKRDETKQRRLEEAVARIMKLLPIGMK